MTDPDPTGQLLVYAKATYHAVTQQRRRQAAVALGVAVAFGLVTLFAGVQWASARAAADDLPDDPLIDALGVRIPDPRPAIARTELRIKGFVWGMVAITSFLLCLMAVGVQLIVRPTPMRPLPDGGPDPPRTESLTNG